MEARSKIGRARNSCCDCDRGISARSSPFGEGRAKVEREIIDFHFSMSPLPLSPHPSLALLLSLSLRFSPSVLCVCVCVCSPSSLSFFFIQNNPTSSFLNRSCANAYNLLPRFCNPEVGSPLHNARISPVLSPVILLQPGSSYAIPSPVVLLLLFSLFLFLATMIRPSMLFTTASFFTVIIDSCNYYLDIYMYTYIYTHTMKFHSGAEKDVPRPVRLVARQIYDKQCDKHDREYDTPVASLPFMFRARTASFRVRLSNVSLIIR